MPARSDLAEMIIGMHFDLADWMGSDAPPKVFDRFSDLFQPEFTAVTTAGRVVDRDTLLAGVWAVRNQVPGVEVEITDIEELARVGNLTVVRFVAENRLGEVRIPRLATATVVHTELGYRLRALHETAVTPDAPAPSLDGIREGRGG
ncbi:hypothetical protein [Nocardia bovistercoris]|uniref:SnoaL-like domain-containing protein n=1 Tax=Nocardia bovistercoris TaxID=2785916 RepID=A0A931I8R4_9NOCA|nr:hypothetical protein [Nocardia bovistercoris]MBH0775935.1 hypothetical protein [Nocardia bovistercoris]